MIYFDSNPKHGPLGFFVGDELVVSGAIHANFQFAKSAARARLAKEIDDRKKLMEELEMMAREGDVPPVNNPFGGF